jgi:hypothetical protein
VAANSKGHVFVFTRSGETWLFEFDKEGRYVREIAPHLYAWAFAPTVRVDAPDNIRAVNEGSNMIVKFSPEGKVVLTLGRKPKSAEVDTSGGFTYHPAAPKIPQPPGQPGSFRRPTEISTPPMDMGNSGVASYGKDGRYIKPEGTTKGNEPGQCSTPRTIAAERLGNVSVGDQGRPSNASDR